MSDEDSGTGRVDSRLSKSSGLIEDVAKDFREFWDLPIKQGTSTYRKTDYDNVNASLIFERLAENGEKDDLVLVCPEDPTNSLLIIIESLLSLLKYDMLNGTAEVLSTVKPGDNVALIERTRKIVPGVYEGTEDRGGVLFHCVRTADGVTKIPPDRSKWRIQPYLAATRLTGRKRSTMVLGEDLEELAGLPPGGLMAFQRSKALLVTPEKGKIIQSIRGVTLGDDPIESVFPIADYTDAENRHHIGGNSLHREPVLGLVSNTDIAVDIALSDPAIKLIIIDGASKIRPHYGSIERLNNDGEARKVICLLKPVDEMEIKTLGSMGLDTWIWKRDDFNDMEKPESSGENEGRPFELHNKIIENLSGPEPATVSVEPLPELDKAVDAVITCIKEISKNTPANDEAGVLFRWGVGLLNSLLQLPVSMDEYRRYLDTLGENSGLELDKKIQLFGERLRKAYGFEIPSVNKDACEKLLENLWDIYKILSLKNPKALSLDKMLQERKGKKVTVLCCRPEYTDTLRMVYRHDPRIKVASINEAGSVTDENAIVTGWLNRRLSAKLFLAPYKNLTYLLYGREALSYSRVLSSHPSSPSSTSDRRLRLERKMKVAVAHQPETEKNSETDIEELIDSVNDKFGTPSHTEHLQAYGTADMVAAKRVIFEDDSCTYLTDTQTVDKLDRVARSTQKCRLADISPGDELIFAESGRDMFEELLAILQQTEKYKLLFEKARLWHRVLGRYVEENHLDEHKLATQLALLGSRPDIATIRGWMHGSVISPAKASLSVIARLTRDQELNDQLDEVMDACTKLYALHIQTGRLLVRRIINAAVQEDEDILNAEAKAKIEAYSQGAKVVTVREVLEATVNTPLRATGKLFEA